MASVAGLCAIACSVSENLLSFTEGIVGRNHEFQTLGEPIQINSGKRVGADVSEVEATVGLHEE